jgi:DNA polymerase III delta subunit
MSDKNIPRLMIVTGDDSFAMELSLDQYLAQIKAKHTQCAVEHYDPSAEKIGEFLARAMTVSLFGDVRAFCILGAQALSESDLKALDQTLEHEITDVYMFISAVIEKTGKGESKIAKTLQLKKRSDDGSILIKTATRPPDYKLAEWIMEQAPAMFKRQIGKPEAEFLAETVEYDLIYSELQKIDMALPPGARIDRQTIQDIVGVTRTMSVYELAAALSKRDLPAALKVVDSLFTSDFYAPLAASAIFKHFWGILKIKKYLEKNQNTLREYNTRNYTAQSAAAFEIGKACGMLSEKDNAKKAYPVIIKSGIVEQSQKFTTPSLKNILDMLQKFDVDIKTGRTEPSRHNLQMLCYKIVR